MQISDTTLLNALSASMKELQRGITAHCILVASFLKEQGDDHSLHALEWMCHARTRELKLENALKEAIEVLEQSRKAFKSRQLEILRKKLTQVLIESPVSQSQRNFL